MQGVSVYLILVKFLSRSRANDRSILLDCAYLILRETSQRCCDNYKKGLRFPTLLKPGKAIARVIWKARGSPDRAG